VSEIVCEEIARRAGFGVSVGNWIAPNGSLILGWDYESHHWETLKKHLNIEEIDNHLQCMNEKVKEGYIRLVFRADVCFHVGAQKKEEIWSDAPNYQRMLSLLRRISEVNIHIFSRTLYIIGQASSIIEKNLGRLQIKETYNA